MAIYEGSPSADHLVHAKAVEAHAEFPRERDRTPEAAELKAREGLREGPAEMHLGRERAA